MRQGLGRPEDAQAHLDGAAGRALRRLVPLEHLRDIGAFFTGERLAAAALELVDVKGRTFADPACGCGDLLLAAAWRLPIAATVDETLQQWGRRLAGRDLEPEFVRAARARLALLALRRGAKPTSAPMPLADLLPEIREGDGLGVGLPGQVVLLNPPYGYTTARAGRDWTRGRVARAATFTLDILETLSPRQELVAVLPDVLRSGTLYERWRQRMALRSEVKHVAPAGPFDGVTNVDVFLLRAVRTEAPVRQWPQEPRADARTVGDLFDISVGALVAYRDAGRGPWRRYIDAHSAGAPGATVTPGRSRRFAGTTHRPPFVAVRRTSAPSRGGPRLRSSVVVGDHPVAVENHLLVATPHARDQDLCRRLMAHLQSAKTTTWLDQRIRCRHLTVASLRELPWPDHENDDSTPALRSPDPRPPWGGTQSAP